MDIGLGIGLLDVRVVLGGFVAAHSLQRLTHWAGGTGLAVSTQEFRDDGFLGGTWTSLLAGMTQVGAGVLVVIGLVTPAAAAGVIGVMTDSTTVKLSVGFWFQDGGDEYPPFLARLRTTLTWFGPGDLSLDRAVGQRRPDREVAVLVSAAATAAGVGAALLRRLILRHNALEKNIAGDAA